MLGEHSHAYKRAISGLRLMDAEVLDPNKRLNFVLGGFHGAWTVADFIDLGNQLHKGEHQNFCLDLNMDPIRQLDRRSNISKLQANLERLPFRSSSVDLLVLDFTLHFLEGNQLSNFAMSCQDVLSPSGIILATHVQFPNQGIWSKFVNWFDEVDRLYKRDVKHVISGLSPLKLNFLGIFKTTFGRSSLGREADFYLMVLSRSDSPLPVRKPSPFMIGKK